MRVNPSDPYAFLSLLTCRAGQVEQLDDVPHVCDHAVQTDWPHVDAASVKRLEREMADLQAQQKFIKIVTFVIAPIAVILLLLLAVNLWTAYRHASYY